MGGQTALNLAIAEKEFLKYKGELIGANSKQFLMQKIEKV